MNEHLIFSGAEVLEIVQAYAETTFGTALDLGRARFSDLPAEVRLEVLGRKKAVIIEDGKMLLPGDLMDRLPVGSAVGPAAEAGGPPDSQFAERFHRAIAQGRGA